MKRVLSVLTVAGLALSLAACGNSASSAAPVESTAASSEAAGFDTTQAITVISREDGSGTRGAFIELTGVEEKNADGQKVDNTTVDAAIANSTNNVMQGVQADETAIGYISMGSLNDTVKAVTVDGVEHILHEGESILMPARHPHAVFGQERFKMLLVVVF